MSKKNLWIALVLALTLVAMPVIALAENCNTPSNSFGSQLLDAFQGSKSWSEGIWSTMTGDCDCGFFGFQNCIGDKTVSVDVEKTGGDTGCGKTDSGKTGKTDSGKTDSGKTDSGKTGKTDRTGKTDGSSTTDQTGKSGDRWNKNNDRNIMQDITDSAEGTYTFKVNIGGEEKEYSFEWKWTWDWDWDYTPAPSATAAPEATVDPTAASTATPEATVNPSATPAPSATATVAPTATPAPDEKTDDVPKTGWRG